MSPTTQALIGVSSFISYILVGVVATAISVAWVKSRDENCCAKVTKADMADHLLLGGDGHNCASFIVLWPVVLGAGVLGGICVGPYFLVVGTYRLLAASSIYLADKLLPIAQRKD